METQPKKIVSVASTQDPITLFRHKQMWRLYRDGGIIVVSIAMLIGAMFLLNKEVTSMRATRGERTYLVATLNSFTDLITLKGKAEEARVELQRSLPSKIAVPTIVIPHLKALARARDVRIDVILGKSTDASLGLLPGVYFSIRADGSLQDIFDFLGALESDPLIVNIAGWRIGPIAPSVYQLNFDAMLYTQAK